MSGGPACTCSQSPRNARRKNWRVLVREGNYSTFNGGRFTRSAYSALICFACCSVWRSKGRFVRLVKDISPQERENWYGNRPQTVQS